MKDYEIVADAGGRIVERDGLGTFGERQREHRGLRDNVVDMAVVRYAEKAAQWGDGWRDGYSDEAVIGRLKRAVDHLGDALQSDRGNRAEILKRAADVVNQALFAASEERIANS